MGALKPYIVSFVNAGITAIKTQEMRETLKHAFAEHGLFSIIRSDERQLQAMMDNLDVDNEEDNMIADHESEVDGSSIHASSDDGDVETTDSSENNF